MSIKRLALIVFILLFVPLIVAASTIYSPTQFQFRMRRYKAEDTLALTFQDLNGSSITEYSLSTKKSIETAQFKLAGSTNWISPYYIKISFPALQLTDGSQPDFYGWYKARIFTDSSLVKEISFNNSSKSTASTIFYGINSDSVDKTVALAYYFGFDFTDYIATYDWGNYSGQIKMEIIPE